MSARVLDPGAPCEAPGPTSPSHHLRLVDILALEAVCDAVLLKLRLPPLHVRLINIAENK